MMPSAVKVIPVFRSVYEGLTKSEKHIAVYIAENLFQMMEQTGSELAQATDTSEMTVSRFCKKMGCSGLKELKLMLAADVPEQEQPLPKDIYSNDRSGDVARKIFRSIAEGLQDTLSLLDYDSIDKAAEALRKANRVVVFGFGNSATVCRDLATRYVRLGLSITDYSDSHIQVTAAALLSPDDVVLAVSHSGASAELLQSVYAAKECGATIIAITSHGQSPLAREAHICLCGMGREVRYSSEAGASRLIHMAIGDVLYTRIAMDNPHVFQRNMEKMRRQISKKKV